MKDEFGRTSKISHYSADAGVIKIYFGKLDTNTIKINSYSLIDTNTNFIVYGKSDNKNIFRLGGRCASRTHILQNSQADVCELETVTLFSDIINKKQSGDYIFYFCDENLVDFRNGLYTKKILASGSFKDGIPTGKWKHYNEGLLYKDIDLDTKIYKYYNGFGWLLEDVNKDSSIYFEYVDRYLKRKSVYYNLHNGGNSENRYEYYSNGKLKTLYTNFSITENNKYLSCKTGKYVEYFESGKVKEIGNFDKDKRVDKWIWYDEAGLIIKEFNYKDGTEIQENKKTN
jgi:antitoxin component YwqK of YwqJK toxin-antitoxin module